MESQSTSTQITQVGIRHSPIVTSRFRTAFGTDIGRRRSQNQDNLAVDPELGLFIVADGMGGHQGGETASAMATESTMELVRAGVKANAENWNPAELISEAIRTASSSIFNRSLQTPHLHGMGTTTTALLAKGSNLTIGHVGDSRCYLFRRKDDTEPYAIWQLTRDHSLVQEKLRAGIITREDIKTDRMKNVITRSLGFEIQIQVETYHIETHPGDIFLICSDGLSGLVPDDEMLRILQRNFPKRSTVGMEEETPVKTPYGEIHLETAPGHEATNTKEITMTTDVSFDPAMQLENTVKRLIKAANENGGDDNISVVMIEVL